jgi:preprotein translocase subunit SecG
MTGVGKITTVVAIVFMLTSLSLAYLSSETARDSVVRDLKPTTSLVPASEQMLIPEEDSQGETTVEIPTAQLEQKAAPPVDSSSGN